MIWIIVYLVSVILLATAIGLIVASDDDKEPVKVESLKGVLAFAGCCVGWPLVICAVLYIILRDYREKSKMKEANRLYDLLKTMKGDNTRMEIISTDECTLKSLLKNVRKGKMKLTDAQIEIVRNELLSRNMERNLTK
jgi:hypothetical protein